MSIDANREIIDDITDKYYYPDSYYSSLDFIYKYTKEVLIKEISGVSKSFFLKMFTDLEDHRFAREKAIKTNSLYNNVHPSVGISINQDFSGSGDRTKMFQSNRFNYYFNENSYPIIYHDNEVTIQLSSNIFKYNIVLNTRFSTAFQASNFAASIANSIPINKYYYPQYSKLRFRINKEIVNIIRMSYNMQAIEDDKFLDTLNKYSNLEIIRDFDKASGNVDYFMLIPIRPLIRVGQLTQTNDNTNGSRDSVVVVPIDIEIELPSTLYFSAPRFLLRKFETFVFSSNEVIKDYNDPILKKEAEERNKDIKEVVFSENPELKVVTMPKVDKKRIEEIHKKSLKYECTLSINDKTDYLIIEDPTIVSYINSVDDTIILKLFDDEGLEIKPRTIKKYPDSIEIYIDGLLEDTLVLVNIYG